MIDEALRAAIIGAINRGQAAFPLDDSETYLADSAYIYMGQLKELFVSTRGLKRSKLWPK